MVQAIQRRLAARNNGDRQGGFTLIELMVVVMIIAILIGIAIPAFLGARGRAQDAAAKSNIRNGLSSATAIFSDNQAYLATADTVTQLTDEEPSLKFWEGGTAAPVPQTEKDISVVVASTNGTTNDTIYLAVLSKSGNCFYVRHVNTPGLATSGSYQAKDTGAASCDAADADDVAVVPAADWDIL